MKSDVGAPSSALSNALLLHRFIISPRTRYPTLFLSVKALRSAGVLIQGSRFNTFFHFLFFLHALDHSHNQPDLYFTPGTIYY